MTSLIRVISNPATCKALMAVSLPAPGPLTSTSICLIPCSSGVLAAASDAVWAANGVTFLAHLNPLAPAEDQENTKPEVSVIETIVLLNVLWMCTTPLGTLRLDFFEPVCYPVAAMMF